MIDKVSQKVNAVEEAKVREEIREIIDAKSPSFIIDRLIRLKYGIANNNG